LRRALPCQTLGYFHEAALLLGPRAVQTVLCGFALVGGGLLGEALTVASAPGDFVLLFVVSATKLGV
jgi:hypothetical protein